MQLFRFAPDTAHAVSDFGSNFLSSRLTQPADVARAAVFYVPPGGLIGEHEALMAQLFCVLEGSGIVWSGEDRTPIRAFEAVLWEKGEFHGTTTDEGMTAVVLEGEHLEAWCTPIER